MSFKSNNLDDIKSLYENIHDNISEEVEDLHEIPINPAGNRPISNAPYQSRFARPMNANTVQSLGRAGTVRPQIGGMGGLGVGYRGAELQQAARARASQVGTPRQGSAGGAVPAAAARPTSPTPRPVPATAAPAAAARPAVAPAGGPKVAPAGATPAKPAGAPMSAMDKWRAANPKLAAAADEKARIRGTQQTDNPLMKDMKSRLPMNSPSVQSPSVAKLGPGNQSLSQNPNAFRAATPTQATAAAPSTSPAASGSVTPVSNRIAAQSSAQQAKSPTFSQAMRMPSLMQSFDYDGAFELVIEYLIDTGHADNLYEAEYIMNELEPEALADIVEAQYGTAAGRKKLAKKVRGGKDVGKKGAGFKKIVKKASKKYGKERATKIAAAAMWKNLAKEE